MYKTEFVTFSKLLRDVSNTKTKADVWINKQKIEDFLKQHKKKIPDYQLNEMMGILHAELLNQSHTIKV